MHAGPTFPISYYGVEIDPFSDAVGTDVCPGLDFDLQRFDDPQHIDYFSHGTCGGLYY